MSQNVYGVLAAAAFAAASPLATMPASATEPPTPIQHVIIIMQENRSFDNYFGTFPGANGIPAGTCVPYSLSDPQQGCLAPYHDPHDYSLGSNHDADGAQHDMDDGITTAKMDGFIESQELTAAMFCKDKPKQNNCGGSGNGWTRHDTVGYHTAEELPNYWTYAQDFILQDSMFSSIRSWSEPSHVFLTSEWLARCGNTNDASTCYTADIALKGSSFPWVSMFQLLDAHQVSWKYYLMNGYEADCDDAEMTCGPQNQIQNASSIYNPAKFYRYVQQQGSGYLAEHNPDLNQFYVDLNAGTLPAVSWIVPNTDVSEHPFSKGITIGMEFVTALVNAVMQSSAWDSTAIFISWDDFGGYYDNVVPPVVDMADPLVNQRPDVGFVEGFGLRVPGLTISPWVRHAGVIDHQVLSFDSYNKFIEDIFMNGARLDPAALGNPDQRPTIRDALTQVKFMDGTTARMGDLMKEFDFTRKPAPPVILATHIPGSIRTYCRTDTMDFTSSCELPTVLVTWDAVTGPQVPGPFIYHVQRDGTELPQCVGTATSCTDTPGTGTHLYRVYSVNSANVASPLSAASEADEP